MPHSIDNTVLDKDYRPSDSEEFMNDTMVLYFKKKLLTWRHELNTYVEEYNQELRDSGMSEPDPNDRATLESERSFRLEEYQRHQKTINDIDLSLQRIDKSEYGYCEETGAQISIRRLLANPTARLSLEAQERFERIQKSHKSRATLGGEIKL